MISALAVSHGLEVFYVYGFISSTFPPAASLSQTIIDYWISFATSLDPNDNHGNIICKQAFVFADLYTNRRSIVPCIRRTEVESLYTEESGPYPMF
jgi:hypothetical protein